jgi:hypothetical protein
MNAELLLDTPGRTTTGKDFFMFFITINHFYDYSCMNNWLRRD